VPTIWTRCPEYVLSPVPVNRRPVVAPDASAAEGCAVPVVPRTPPNDIVALVPGAGGEGDAAVDPAAALVEPAVPVAAGVPAVRPTVVPAVAGVPVVVPTVAGVPVVLAVVAGMPVVVPAVADVLSAVLVLPVFGGTCPPERLVDVADVLLVIPDEAGVLLVTPGVEALICVGFVKVNGSKLVAPRATHPTRVMVGPDRELEAYDEGCVADCPAAGGVDGAVCSAYAVTVDTRAAHRNA
jgi:hypothetical protein